MEKAWLARDDRRNRDTEEQTPRSRISANARSPHGWTKSFSVRRLSFFALAFRKPNLNPALRRRGSTLSWKIARLLIRFEISYRSKIWKFRTILWEYSLTNIFTLDSHFFISYTFFTFSKVFFFKFLNSSYSHFLFALKEYLLLFIASRIWTIIASIFVLVSETLSLIYVASMFHQRQKTCVRHRVCISL